MLVIGVGGMTGSTLATATLSLSSLLEEPVIQFHIFGPYVTAASTIDENISSLK